MIKKSQRKTEIPIAFEALPENLNRLRDNLSMNDLGSRVRVEPLAVTGQTGPVQFHVGPSGGTGKVEGSTGRDNICYSSSITISGVHSLSFHTWRPAFNGRTPLELQPVEVLTT